VSALQEFLNAHPVDGLTEEVVISDRFRGPDGELLKFKIKVMTNRAFEDARKKSTIVKKGGKVEFDLQRFNNAIVIEHTLVPDFKDAASIQRLGCATPEDYLNRVLLPGEITELADRIQRLSGFNRSLDDLVEEAKN
jgi:hypothetical protein